MPRLLVIDDVFGRTATGGPNRERAHLCGQYLIEDVTGDSGGAAPAARIRNPVAQAVFARGQTPRAAALGDTVENDLDGTLALIAEGWDGAPPARPRWSLVLLDLCFYTGRVTDESHARTPGMPEGRPGDDDPDGYFGLQLLRAIQECHPDLPVVILSSKPRGEVSQVFARYGALGFLPRADERSPELLREYIGRHGLIPDEAGEIVGNSKSLLLTLRAARRASAERRNVLILGERGTGKELLARYIHRQRGRAGPYVVVDSGTLSPQLYASELFGHRRGAYTGADRDRIGRIAQAAGGDLFLDEIGNMPADVQVGLLRVLEHRRVVPLGATEGEEVDVRFLSATNEDLEGRAATGGFRQDLLDRLRDGGTIHLRPLRERGEDLPALVEAFVREAEAARPLALRRQIDEGVLERLRTHDWPGNVRELHSCIWGAISAFPDVEYLVPGHLGLGRAAPAPDAPTQRADHADLPAALESLLAEAAELLKDARPADLAGLLPRVQRGYQRLLARLLRASLQATRRVTVDSPEGMPLIHPALKLLTGDRRLTASRAADLVKRLLGVDMTERNSLLADDPTLAEAYLTSLRLRPRRPQDPGLDRPVRTADDPDEIHP